MLLLFVANAHPMRYPARSFPEEASRSPLSAWFFGAGESRAARLAMM